MVNWSEFRMEKNWDDDHREDAPQFIRSRNQFYGWGQFFPMSLTYAVQML